MADHQKEPPPPVQFSAESQKERWLKYGANVVLTVIVVILLGLALIYIGQRNDLRKDTTAGGDYSLKPQTVHLIENLPQKVKLVGLFSKAKQEQEKKVNDDSAEVHYQQVADLLQEYQQKSGGKISAEMIDPITEPGKLDQLFNDVAKRYGNDINKYQDVINAYPKTLSEIKELSNQEIAALKKLPKISEPKLGQMLNEAYATVQIFPQLLDQISIDAKQELQYKVPDYKGAVDKVRSGLEGLNDRIDSIVKSYKTAAAEKSTPREIKDYFIAAEPRYETMKKAGDELLKKAQALGSIKQLDDLRQNKSNSIAVMGEKDLKVLPFSAIYKSENARVMDAQGNIKPRFAGEQQVSTALVALTSKEKKKVAFIRSGGPPLATSIPMVQYEAPMSIVANRLRDYNIEVLEKDVSGQWAMQAMQLMQQGMPIPPEPQDDQLKDAIWIVQVMPQNPRQMMTNPGAAIGPKVAEHLRQGGSAMLMVYPQTEKFDFLKEWGIEPKPDHVIVHEKIAPQGARSADPTDDWQRQQVVFSLKNYGDHLIARPLQSLDSLFIPLIPVMSSDVKGVKLGKLLPIPTTPPCWAEGDFASLREGKEVKFGDKVEGAPADLPPPLWAGAAAENARGARLVVFGSADFANNDRLQQPDYEVLRTQQRLVPRFPGNGELFMNSVFWLTKMDTMIAISPTALDVPRVRPISDGLLRFWRIGVLVLGMPALVLIAGTFVYLKRRD